jgi:chromosome partitioning protein
MNTKVPPTIIALASGKGGVGKSTACLALAGALAEKGETVHIVDFDQNETLWTWYAGHEPARQIQNLTVEQAPKSNIAEFIEALYTERSGYVLIDLAGSLNDVMMLVAVFANIVIIPSKLGIADVMQADKLAEKLHQIGDKIGKPILHRILLNELPYFLAASQVHLMNQVNAMGVQRFENVLHVRPAYAEPQITGVPIQFDDRTRESTNKACKEVTLLLDEILALITPVEMKAAA